MVVELTREEHVAIITIKRPEARNAINGDVAEALEACLDDFDDEDGGSSCGGVSSAGSVSSRTRLRSTGAPQGSRSVSVRGDGCSCSYACSFTCATCKTAVGEAVGAKVLTISTPMASTATPKKRSSEEVPAAASASPCAMSAFGALPPPHAQHCSLAVKSASSSMLHLCGNLTFTARTRAPDAPVDFHTVLDHA